MSNNFDGKFVTAAVSFNIYIYSCNPPSHIWVKRSTQKTSTWQREKRVQIHTEYASLHCKSSGVQHVFHHQCSEMNYHKRRFLYLTWHLTLVLCVEVDGIVITTDRCLYISTVAYIDVIVGSIVVCDVVNHSHLVVH